jgi:hypothetical protein
MPERIQIHLKLYDRTQPDAITRKPQTVSWFLEERLDQVPSSIRRPSVEKRVAAMKDVCASCTQYFECETTYTSPDEGVAVQVNGNVLSPDCKLKTSGYSIDI